MQLCNNKNCGKKHPKVEAIYLCRNCLFKAQNESDVEDGEDEVYDIEQNEGDNYIEKIGSAVLNKHNSKVEYTDGFLDILSKGSSQIKMGFEAMFEVYESCVGVKRLEGRKVAEGEIDCTQYERVQTIVEGEGRGKYLFKRKKYAPDSIQDIEIQYTCIHQDGHRVIKWTAP